jgi:tripartite-type tricarboxylate transporter receptor subunit TctC
LAAAVLLVGSVLHPAYAQEFPTRTVKIVVPFPAGGSADVVPRVVADWLSRRWGQAVIIENRAGAAGNIGAELAYKAEPDGYTLLSTPSPPLVVNQSLYPKLKFDPALFERIIVLGRIPNAIVTTSTFAAKNVSELIAYAKANPNKINCAIAGYGTTSHLTSELFQMMAGVKFQHVPYTGSAPALNDLAGGGVDIMFDNLGVARALVDSGKLRLLAVASAKRISSLPGVPTVAETLPGFESDAFYTVVAPPGTLLQIVRKINADIDATLRSPDVAERLEALSAVIVGGTPEQTSVYLRVEAERWKNVIRSANVRMQ